MLNACSLRRPHAAIEEEFPELRRTSIITFPLDSGDRRRSNDAYRKCKKCRRPNGTYDKLAGWRHLVAAHQYTQPRILVELRFERHALERAMRQDLITS
ncbi:hypothetical protein ACHAO9_005989, partial [Fusarium lateritium]